MTFVDARESGHQVAPAGHVLHRLAVRESSARTYARALPIVPLSAQGMWVRCDDGRTYLDCLSGAGTLALGHNHPVVVEAIRKVLDGGAPLHVLDIATVDKDEFTTSLFESLPEQLARHGRIHFCGPAGTDAVEAALKLVQTATGHRGLLTFTGAYHGMTTGALAVSGNVGPRSATGIVAAEVTRLPFPYPYRCPFGLGGSASATVASSYVERLLDDPNGGVGPSAGMIVETVQGEGGVVPAPAAWLRRMRAITAERNIPLVVDEVQTGVGRTGTMWGVEDSDVTPDVMILSKAIGGSLPLAVIVYTEALDVWLPGAHTGTFRGNTLAMAAGAATLRFVRAEQLAQRARDLGRRLLGELEAMAREHPSIGQVRGRGLMLGLELVDGCADVDSCGARPAAPALAAAVRRQCLRNGLIVELGGRHDSVVRLLPPLTMSDAEAGQVLDRLAAALTAAEAAHFCGRV